MVQWRQNALQLKYWTNLNSKGKMISNWFRTRRRFGISLWSLSFILFSSLMCSSCNAEQVDLKSRCWRWRKQHQQPRQMQKCSLPQTPNSTQQLAISPETIKKNNYLLKHWLSGTHCKTVNDLNRSNVVLLLWQNFPRVLWSFTGVHQYPFIRLGRENNVK